MSQTEHSATGSRPGGRRAGHRVAEQRRTAERLVALLVLGVVVLNYPLLSVLHGRGQVAGIPVLYLSLFLIWALLAGATAFALRRRPPGPDPAAEAQRPREQ